MLLQKSMTLGFGQVSLDHLSTHLPRTCIGGPAKLNPGLAGVPEKSFNFGRAKITRIDGYNYVPYFHCWCLVTCDCLYNSAFIDAVALKGQSDSQFFRRPLDERSHRVLLAGCDNEVFRFV